MWYRQLKTLVICNVKVNFSTFAGESHEEMESGKTLDVLNKQITSVLKNKTLNNALIAYEPIWAIGTGKTPTPIQVNQINQYIKDVVQSTTENDCNFALCKL